MLQMARDLEPHISAERAWSRHYRIVHDGQVLSFHVQVVHSIILLLKIFL